MTGRNGKGKESDREKWQRKKRGSKRERERKWVREMGERQGTKRRETEGE